MAQERCTIKTLSAGKFIFNNNQEIGKMAISMELTIIFDIRTFPVAPIEKKIGMDNVSIKLINSMMRTKLTVCSGTWTSQRRKM